MFRVLLATVLLARAAHCGASAPPAEDPESIVRALAPPERIVDTRTGEDVDLEVLRRAMLETKVIYVGEQHDQPAHQAAEYLVIRTLHGMDPQLEVGMEMFQQPYQEALDEWVAGRMDENSLRRRTEYDQRWGHDFRVYRPLLEFARGRAVPIWALNAPQELTRAVAHGGLESLDEAQRGQLPADLVLDDGAHRAMVAEALAEHDHGGAMDEAAVERMYQAQVVWDETMAAKVADILARPGGPSHLVVLAGAMHIRRGLGIPRRAARRGATPFLTILPVADEDELDEELARPRQEVAADYLWLP